MMLLYEINLHFVSLSGHEVNKPSHALLSMQAEATHVNCS